MPLPHLALGLAGPHLVELTGSPVLLARWDALPVAFTVLGIDRVDGAAPARPTLESSAAGAVLAGRTTRGRFLVTATPQRDHPYNLARRVASLGHLSRGRSGLLLGVRDVYAAPGPAEAGAWGGAGLGPGAPLTAATALDVARAVRALEQSWPYDTIVGDRATGILVRSDHIHRVDHDGAFRIAGPLTVPEPATGASVIAWYASTPTEAVAADSAPVDLVIGAGGSVAVVGLGEWPAADAEGVLLRPSPEQGVEEVLAAAERLLADGGAAATPHGPLRAALRLPSPVRPEHGRAAFPVPRPSL